ncbi:mannosyl-oligosaccharide glucosidase [Vigna unguiculata]|uniref:Mannosyl-oligosaccharide glucosidase n=1 Tax=Vigna unguiculata TaxID=3917 RepID=A0A4D6L4H7_VIGUN|nr:mannosyl-oligosaccharide glucosidase [Vigna unguiculata]
MTGSGRTAVRSRAKSLSDADSRRERRPLLNRHRERSKYGSSIPIFNTANLKVVLGICFVAFFTIFFMIRHLTNSATEPKLPRAVTPFPAPKIMDLPQFQGEHKESLYWGTYRPHTYFGIRARTPKSLMAGLMWIGVKDGRYHLRHVCRHEDDLSTYGWTKHNGRDFGHQVLVDHGMTLTTRFLKSKVEDSGYGGDWAVQINVGIDKSKWNEEFGKGAQLFFYLADEAGNALDVSRENLNIHEDSLLATGSRGDIGDWKLHLKSMDDLELHYSGFRTPHFHNLSDLVEENLASQIHKHARLQLSDSLDDAPNVLVFQIIGGFPFATDIVLITGTDIESSQEERVSMLTGTSLSNQLKYKEQEFDQKFEKIFNLAEKVDSESISVAKAAIGNLLGGIGYFYGQSKIALSRILNALSSGLDDYPRASHPSEDEYHLDLRCWMLLAADCMHSIQELLDMESKPGMDYGYTAKLLSNFELLNQMHFDDAYGAYFDFGNHTEKVQLRWKEVEAGNYATRQLVRDVTEIPVLRLVPHIGYVSLFPFMGRIIPPESWILEKQLELISNRSLLWTNYGLRSLAKTSSLYMKHNTEHDPPYWRGPVWINMNYRILSALHHYSQENGPYQEKAKVVYEELRSNLIRNIVRNYQHSGFLWEQYDQIKGKGKGAHPFTGWTSLVVLIMAEAYGNI